MSKIKFYINNLARRRLVDNLLIHLGQTFFTLTSLILNKYLGKFQINGKNYNYQVSRYGMTWFNERAVEIAIFKSIIKKANTSKLLEVGNVLSHYTPTDWDIVDKYEVSQTPKVTNIDIVSYRPKKKYDLIISISTLEHIGFDEDDKNPTKIIKAIQKLKEIKSKKGKIIFSIPIGFNKHLDEQLKNGVIKTSSSYFLKKVDKFHWETCTKNEAFISQYNYPFESGNAIGVYTIS